MAQMASNLGCRILPRTTVGPIGNDAERVGREDFRMSVVPVFPNTHRQPEARGGRKVDHWRGGLNVVREVTIVALAAYLYFFVRGLIHSRESEAMDNAQWLISKE